MTHGIKRHVHLFNTGSKPSIHVHMYRSAAFPNQVCNNHGKYIIIAEFNISGCIMVSANSISNPDRTFAAYTQYEYATTTYMYMLLAGDLCRNCNQLWFTHAVHACHNYYVLAYSVSVFIVLLHVSNHLSLSLSLSLSTPPSLSAVVYTRLTLKLFW